MNGKSYTRISAVALVPLCLALPQGVGIAVGGSTVDLPRICTVMFAILSLFLIATKATGFGRLLPDKCAFPYQVIGISSADESGLALQGVPIRDIHDSTDIFA